MTILSILNELAATSKRTEKESILRREIRNEELKLVLWAAYNPDITYWISKHPDVSEYDRSGVLGESMAIVDLLDNIAIRKITGNAAIEFYRKTLEKCTADQAEVIRRVVDRDLRCGVGVPTINKIWPLLIPEYELMLAETDAKKLKYPCYVQTKMDGLRCLITHTNPAFNIVMRTRGGNQITSLEAMYDHLSRVIPPGETWDGELVCVGEDGRFLERKISNGILNKAIRGTISPQEVERVIFVVWDIIDQTKTIPYKDRFAQLSARLNLDSRKVVLVQNWRADNLKQVERLFEIALLGGEEGVIAKNIDAVWQPKRTFDLVKFKAEKECDLLVTGWEFGKANGKNAHRLGALVCESADGKVVVNVGGGYSDEERDKITPEFAVDKIIEVVYNSRISKKDGGSDSLYLSRFKKFRPDKTTASSSEEIK